MNRNHQSLHNSLRCLQHPAAFLSILLLLVNDHVLKVVSPSWLTGKLSDFAGLFFFPFVVGACLSLLAGSLQVPSHRIGQISFGTVAVWFTLLKTVPLANARTAQLASLLIGAPTHFALDPTDLIALIALLPAWKLWNSPQRALPSRFAYVALAIGALAAIATSPAPNTLNVVTDLGYSQDGVLYAADQDGYGKDWFPVAVSLDGGLTWEESGDTTRDMQYIDARTYPIDYCKYLDYYGVTHCYRVTQSLEFQYGYKYRRNTKDSFTWAPVFRRNSLSVKAYDMLVFPCGDRECILVAIGEAGVLRRVFPDGKWEIINVWNARSNEIFRNGAEDPTK